MKLLTNIFRTRAENSKGTPPDAPGIPSVVGYPLKVDVHIVNFIFTEFRQHIIPQTCALIFLQGKIHQRLASPDDFPLNLWDMERMYEGVYQYLEFFAVLTEENVWKEVMAQWEVASELVTLLKELEAAIPKLVTGGSSHLPLPHRPLPSGLKPGQPTTEGSQPSKAGQKPTPVSVERPFDVSSDSNPTLPPLPVPLPTPVPHTDIPDNPIYEAETPLAFPEDATDPQDEPSDFEWRNLKKLTVLVLSSLIWKNKGVQDQVRRYGGLEALVGCCKHDEHNPYIREHAIMCLRFAVEGNEENAAVIKRMASSNRGLEGAGNSVTGAGYYAEGAVPREVLDTNGYETFMDGKGQVGLRRKDVHGGTAGVSSGPSKKPLTTTKMTAEKAAELMQTALRDLPLGEKMVLDRDKRDALAKLDKAFEAKFEAKANPKK